MGSSGAKMTFGTSPVESLQKTKTTYYEGEKSGQGPRLKLNGQAKNSTKGGAGNRKGGEEKGEG